MLRKCVFCWTWAAVKKNGQAESAIPAPTRAPTSRLRFRLEYVHRPIAKATWGRLASVQPETCSPRSRPSAKFAGSSSQARRNVKSGRKPG